MLHNYATGKIASVPINSATTLKEIKKSFPWARFFILSKDRIWLFETKKDFHLIMDLIDK